MTSEAQSLSEADLGFLKKLLQKHRAPPDGKSAEPWVCLAVTLGIYLGALALTACTEGWMAVLPCCILAGASVRCFIAFHDCCHLSFFRSRTLNKAVAHFLAPMSGRSLVNWMEKHHDHHQNLGDASHFDGSLTVHHDVAEYNAFPFPKRMAYRFVRDPFIFFPFASLWVFFVSAFTVDIRNSWPRIPLYALYYVVAGRAALCKLFVASWMGGLLGCWLFHLQHQCNQMYRVPTGQRRMVDAGIMGSTFLVIPWPLKWVTLGIEFHHIHHASTLVPCYRLSSCHDEGEKAGLWRRGGINVVGPKRALKSVFHALFDERPSRDGKNGCLDPKFVSFEPYASLGLQD